MQSAYGKAVDTWEKNGAYLFVHFDFMFFPMRVHSGQGSLEWEGHEWHGIGNVLRQDASSMWSVLSSETSERGRMSASLPMSKEMREVLSEEYYRDRKMQWMICAVDANGNVMRRVYINTGRIVSYESKDDTVTFSAECEFLDSLREKDARHKRRVVAIRQRFKWGLVDAIMSNSIGWAVNVGEAIAGSVGFVVDAFEVLMPGRNRRIAKQWWTARRRTYWFRTQPEIPGMRMHRNGYRLRGDTLDEAKSRLYETVASRVWDIAPSFVSMVIYVDNRPLEFLNLDKLRRDDDPVRFEETTRMRGWPP